MALVIVILVLLLTLAFFYLKCSMMQSFATLWSTILSTIIAFSYYEWAAEFFISRGYALNWVLAGCFSVLFIVVFAVLRSISEVLIPSPIDLGNAIKLPVSLVCGLFTGLIVSGNLLVSLGLIPMHGKVFYSRFDPEAAVVLKDPRTPALNTDGFVTELYNWISAGSMSSDSSFGVLHADYLSQIHLNKLKTKDDVLSVCSREALVLPKDNDLKPIRRQTSDDKEITVVRVGILKKDIEKGGAGVNVKFFPAQIRLIVKKDNAAELPMAGTAEALYPIGFWENRSLKKTKPGEIIEADSKKIKEGVFWMDVAFEVPEETKPVLLEFKQTAVVDLTPYDVVQNTLEIEQSLDDEGQKEKSS